MEMRIMYPCKVRSSRKNEPSPEYYKGCLGWIVEAQMSAYDVY